MADSHDRPQEAAGGTEGEAAGAAAGQVRLSQPAGRWILLAAVLGSGLAMLDATVVNVALPALGRELDASLAGLQWTVNAYTLTLAGLILLGGSLGDRYGRRRIFVIGVVWFALASLLCGIAPNIWMLVAARALQGVGGALLTPGSLAMIQASFHPDERARAVGAWSGMSGVAAAAGPFLGGWVVDAVSWRVVFLLNVPLAVVVVAVAVRHVPESADPSATGRFDVVGATLAAVGLAGITYALAEAPENGASAAVIAAGVLGVASLVGFVGVERYRAHPMLPLDVFASRQFTAVNVVTLAVYAALGGMFFLLILQLQVVAGFSALAAGAALLPITLLMLAFSARAGALSQRIGPRTPMTVGPLVGAVGVLLVARIDEGAVYLRDVLPGITVFGIGLTLTVAPLTATVLAAAQVRRAGIASGVNNAVARAAGLLAVATLPLLVGLSGDDYQRPDAFDAGFRAAMLVCAGLLAAGGLVAWLTIRTDVLTPTPVRACPRPDRERFCEVGAPPIESPEAPEALAGTR